MFKEKFFSSQEEKERKSIKKRRIESRKEKGGMTRRDFLIGLGVLAAGSAAGINFVEKDNQENREKEDEEIEEVDLETEETDETDEREIEEVKKYIAEKQKEIDGYFDFNSTEPIKLTEQKADKVKNEYWKIRYKKGILRKDYNEALTGMRPYISKLEATFKKNYVPEKYLYLAIPESHWKLKAKSSKGARGPYQFTTRTGRMYGLKIDYSNPKKIIDEREDPLKSGNACAKLLKDLHKKTKDWNLSLSGYNGGFMWKYLKQCRGTKENVSYAGFLKYISGRATRLRDRIKNESVTKVRIARGDNLFKLSRKFAVSVDEIKKMNNKKSDVIKVGEVIKIPSRNDKQKERTYRKLVAGYKENFKYAPKVNAVLELIEAGMV